MMKKLIATMMIVAALGACSANAPGSDEHSDMQMDADIVEMEHGEHGDHEG